VRLYIFSIMLCTVYKKNYKHGTQNYIILQNIRIHRYETNKMFFYCYFFSSSYHLCLVVRLYHTRQTPLSELRTLDYVCDYGPSGRRCWLDAGQSHYLFCTAYVIGEQISTFGFRLYGPFNPVAEEIR